MNEQESYREELIRGIFNHLSCTKKVPHPEESRKKDELRQKALRSRQIGIIPLLCTREIVFRALDTLDNKKTKNQAA